MSTLVDSTVRRLECSVRMQRRECRRGEVLLVVAPRQTQKIGVAAIANAPEMAGRMLKANGAFVLRSYIERGKVWTHVATSANAQKPPRSPLMDNPAAAMGFALAADAAAPVGFDTATGFS